MSPLVEYLGNATPQDNTEVIRLHDADDGSPRSILIGGDAVEVSGDELRAMASHYQVRVVEDVVESPPPPPDKSVTPVTSSISAGPIATASPLSPPPVFPSPGAGG